MNEPMIPDPFLTGQTDMMLAEFRQIRDAWAVAPHMQSALSIAELIAVAVDQEFPGHPDAPRIIAAMTAGLSAARKIVLMRDGVRLGTGTLLELARVAAVELDDKAAGRG